VWATLGSHERYKGEAPDLRPTDKKKGMVPGGHEGLQCQRDQIKGSGGPRERERARGGEGKEGVEESRGKYVSNEMERKKRARGGEGTGRGDGMDEGGRKEQEKENEGKEPKTSGNRKR